MTHPLIADHPAVAAIDAQADRLAANKQKHYAAQVKAREKYDAAAADWTVRNREAALAGKPAPARPDALPPPEPGVADAFVAEERRLRAHRQRVIAEHADSIDAAVRDRHDVLVTGARDHLAAALADLPELAGLVDAARTVRHAQAVEAVADPSLQSTPPPSTYGLPSTVDPRALVDFLLAGTGPIGPPPAVTRQPEPAAAETLPPMRSAPAGGLTLRH